MLDDDVLALVLELKAMADKLRAKGLKDDDLQDLLSRDEKGIALSQDGTLELLDYGKKIRLNPLERTLYAFLLKHEDGVMADNLWMYYDELVGSGARFSCACLPAKRRFLAACARLRTFLAYLLLKRVVLALRRCKMAIPEMGGYE